MYRILYCQYVWSIPLIDGPRPPTTMDSTNQLSAETRLYCSHQRRRVPDYIFCSLEPTTQDWLQLLHAHRFGMVFCSNMDKIHKSEKAKTDATWTCRKSSWFELNTLNKSTAHTKIHIGLKYRAVFFCNRYPRCMSERPTENDCATKLSYNRYDLLRHEAGRFRSQAHVVKDILCDVVPRERGPFPYESGLHRTWVHAYKFALDLM